MPMYQYESLKVFSLQLDQSYLTNWLQFIWGWKLLLPQYTTVGPPGPPAKIWAPEPKTKKLKKNLMEDFLSFKVAE